MYMTLFRKPAVFRPFSHLIAAESTRHGGVSQGPYASLNLGKNTADRPDHVAENLRLFCAALGFSPGQIAWSRQVHGAEVSTVTNPGGASGFDALITQTPGIVLAVSVADCAPVLVFDTENQAVATIHAGWRGAAAGIVQKTLERMAAQFGTRGAHCVAYIGTCIDVCSFEVGPEVAAEFATDFKRPGPGHRKFFIDLKKACAAQLETFGVPSGQIEHSAYSTVLHGNDYFSHRLSGGVTGRMLAVIGILGTMNPAEK
ncbi:MAG: peptidoglycan editing factor PgeF [Saprospirales bacterium]|nr:peptidoglycan editing factor PgeF [Saprospirales bacterium]